MEPDDGTEKNQEKTAVLWKARHETFKTNEISTAKTGTCGRG